MNKNKLDEMLQDSEDNFMAELLNEESKEYRTGYYAGRLHACLELKAAFKEDMDKIDGTLVYESARGCFDL